MTKKSISLRMILRVPAVQAASGYSRSTLYSRISQGLWTSPVHIGPRAVGWPDFEVSMLNSARIAGKTDEDIKCLVKELEIARKTLL